MEQRFTEWQRQKLVKLGFTNMSNCSQRNIVKYGNGNYSKRFGNIYITSQIRNHIIKRFAFSLPYQGTDFAFAKQCLVDIEEGMKFIKNLGYFD